jgi:hypothetical protein
MGPILSAFRPPQPDKLYFTACESNDIQGLRSALQLLNTRNLPIADVLNGTRDVEGRTGLMVAAKCGSTECVKELVRLGAKCNVRHIETGTTALHYAAGWGNSVTVDALLSLGGDPTVTSAKGFTPLDMARFHQKLQVVRLIEARTALFCGWILMEKSTKLQSGVGKLLGEGAKEALRKSIGGEWKEQWVTITRLHGSQSGASIPCVVSCARCRTELRPTIATSERITCGNCSLVMRVPPPVPSMIYELAIYNNPQECRPSRAYSLAGNSSAKKTSPSASLPIGHIPIAVRVPKPMDITIDDVKNGSISDAGVIEVNSKRVLWTQARLSQNYSTNTTTSATTSTTTNSRNNNSDSSYKTILFATKDVAQANAFLSSIAGPARVVAEEPGFILHRRTTGDGNNNNSQPINSWTCPACTFVNHMPDGAVEECLMCTTPRFSGMVRNNNNNPNQSGGPTFSGMAATTTTSTSTTHPPIRTPSAPFPPSNLNTNNNNNNSEDKNVMAVVVPPPPGPFIHTTATEEIATAIEVEGEEEEAFFCPITNVVMVDPVVTADGMTYERRAIEAWFAQGHNTSPSTGLPLTSTSVAPNHALRNAIQNWRRRRNVPEARLALQ